MEKIKYFAIIITFFLAISILLTGSIKGQKGNPIYHQTQLERDSSVGSPFESSGTSSRYALIEAIVEDRTFFFNKERARFSAPDFVEYNGKFFSIFTPGVSFLGIPFYLFGKSIGLSQLVTFLSTVLLAILNVFLVVRLALKLGATLYTALLSGFIFLFATNSLSYAHTLSQHHASVTFILLALLNVFGPRTFLKNIWLGFISGAALLVDIPNILIVLPVIFYVILKHFRIDKISDKFKFSLKLKMIGLLIGLVPLIGLFGWYNHQLTGSYTKIGQAIGRSDFFEPFEVREQNRLEKESKDVSHKIFPLDTRDQMGEFYILLVSNQRGWLIYSPVILIGVLGVYYLYKNQKTLAIVVISTILSNIILYSLFGGLGGWAFGPRYLIPSAAILSSLIGTVIEKFKRTMLFILAFSILLAYSLGVNMIGAITTTQVPPKVEAVNLPNPIPYTYEYNLQLIDKNFTSSLIYNLYLSEIMSVKEFLYVYYAITLMVIVSLYLFILIQKGKTEKPAGGNYDLV